jgi:hypothetical protein
VPVRHHSRRFGTSKYGLSRVVKLLADLVTLKMISSFRERPLALFALAALVPLFAATLVGGAWTYGVMVGWGWRHEGVYVLPGTALILIAFAVHLVMLGLLAEQWLLARTSARAASHDESEGAAACDR